MKAAFERLKLEITGSSHSENMQVILGGLPQGYVYDSKEAEEFVARRKSGRNVWSTPRKEEDVTNIISGITDGATDGNAFVATIENKSVKAGDYAQLSVTPRPSHADYVMYEKDGKIESGGGRFSGRLTAPLCAAGALAHQVLKANGVRIYAYVSSVGGVSCGSYKSTKVTEARLKEIRNDGLSVLFDENKDKVIELISKASKEDDSVGGIVECVILGLEAGAVGESMMEGLEGKIAYSVFGVPAVKGIEFGEGFGLASMRGSEANDAFGSEDGKVVTLTNKSGGINGGISNGMPVTFSVCIRPTPSISKPQRTVNLKDGTEVEIEIKGRHDACIVPRAVAAVESAAAIAVLDEMLKYGKIK